MYVVDEGALGLAVQLADQVHTGDPLLKLAQEVQVVGALDGARGEAVERRGIRDLVSEERTGTAHISGCPGVVVSPHGLAGLHFVGRVHRCYAPSNSPNSCASELTTVSGGTAAACSGA